LATSECSSLVVLSFVSRASSSASSVLCVALVSEPTGLCLVGSRLVILCRIWVSLDLCLR